MILLRCGCAAICLTLLILPAAFADECALEAPICAARGAVFRIETYDPAASAVRISANLLVTNRHVVADETAVRIVLADNSWPSSRAGVAIGGWVKLDTALSLDEDVAVWLSRG